MIEIIYYVRYNVKPVDDNKLIECGMWLIYKALGHFDESYIIALCQIQEVLGQNSKLRADSLPHTLHALDSRQVAEMIEKDHKNLLRDIEGYIGVLDQSSKMSADSFFLEHSYKAGTGKTYPCYLLTRKGCEFVANKLTGEKGILFTAAAMSNDALGFDLRPLKFILGWDDTGKKARGP